MSRPIVTLLLFVVFLPLEAQEARLRDPMQPFEPVATSGARGSAPRQFELTAVLVSKDRKIAVINGSFHREGDRINGAEITRIEPQAVHLQRGSDETVLRLTQQRTELQITRGEPSS